MFIFFCFFFEIIIIIIILLLLSIYIGELLTGKILLESRPSVSGHDSDLAQINKITDVIGTPTEAIWPGLNQLPHCQNFSFRVNKPCRLREILPEHPGPMERPYLSNAGYELLTSLLCYDPAQRISAREALNHRYFQELPVALDPGYL